MCNDRCPSTDSNYDQSILFNKPKKGFHTPAQDSDLNSLIILTYAHVHTLFEVSRDVPVLLTNKSLSEVVRSTPKRKPNFIIQEASLVIAHPVCEDGGGGLILRRLYHY